MNELNERKKAPLDDGTSNRARETGLTEKVKSISENYFIKKTGTEQEKNISHLLSIGQGNAVTLQHLVTLTGWPKRVIRKQIEKERRAGVLILSDNRSGYYLASDEVEAQQFARSMRHRAGEILRTARAIEGAAGID